MPGRASDVTGPSAGPDSGMAARPAGRREGPAGPGRGWQRVARWVPMCVPGIVVLVLDGFDLGRVSLWRDEAYTLDVAQRPLSAIFTMLHHTDAVNSTYYMFMHGAIALFGTSTAGLRVPSVLAMAVAAVVTAVIGRRLAAATSLPAPALTGMAAGLLFAVAPQVTRYAQEARAYAIVTMLAAIATYLLLRGAGEGRWRWWAAYGVTVVAIGLFNMLGLLLVAAHAVTLGIAWLRTRAGGASPRRPSAGQPATGGAAGGEDGPPASAPRPAAPRLARWLTACVVAGVLLIPLLLLGYQQKRQVSWLHKPGPGAVIQLASAFAGSRLLLPLVGLIALAGVAASFSRLRRQPLDLAAVALPWLVLPPVILLLVSQIHPYYDGRYVTYCLPGLALLLAGGLAWLARYAKSTPLARVDPRLVWLPAALVLLVLAVLLVKPQESVRGLSSRPDNLRKVSAVLAAHARPGDAVFYLPVNRRVDSVAYPGPFRQLRDIALKKTPEQAFNLLGKDVTPQVLRQRFVGVQRVWVISGLSRKIFLAPRTGIEKAEVGLLQPMHLAGRWYAGEDMVSLYVRG